MQHPYRIASHDSGKVQTGTFGEKLGAVFMLMGASALFVVIFIAPVVQAFS